MSKNICVWKNPSITDMGRKLDNKLLIDNNILYLSDFIDSEGNVLPYLLFRYKFGISNELKTTDYLNIKLAIRRAYIRRIKG